MDIDQTIVDSRCVSEAKCSGKKEDVISAIKNGEIRPYEDMVNIIYAIRNCGNDIVFASDSPRYYCDELLRQLGLGYFVDNNKLITYDRDNMHPKPYPDLFLKAKDLFDDKYQPYVIVGDSTKDINAAKSFAKQSYENNESAKNYALRCLWGVSKDEYANEEDHGKKPYMILESPFDLLVFLNNLSIYQSRKDQNDVLYCFNYYPVNGKYTDEFTDYFINYLKKDVWESDIERKSRYYMKSWSKQFIDLAICNAKKEYNIDNKQIGLFTVPSSSEGRWNAAIAECVREINNENGLDNYSDYLYRHTTKERAHLNNDRSIENNCNTMRLQSTDGLDKLSCIIIIDDVTSTGNTFKACKKVIERDAKSIFNGHIIFLAIGKTIHIKEGLEISTVSQEKHIAQPIFKPFNEFKKFWIKYPFKQEDKNYFHHKRDCKYLGKNDIGKWYFPNELFLNWFIPSEDLEPCNLCCKL